MEGCEVRDVVEDAAEDVVVCEFEDGARGVLDWCGVLEGGWWEDGRSAVDADGAHEVDGDVGYVVGAVFTEGETDDE